MLRMPRWPGHGFCPNRTWKGNEAWITEIVIEIQGRKKQMSWGILELYHTAKPPSETVRVNCRGPDGNQSWTPLSLPEEWEKGPKYSEFTEARGEDRLNIYLLNHVLCFLPVQISHCCRARDGVLFNLCYRSWVDQRQSQWFNYTVAGFKSSSTDEPGFQLYSEPSSKCGFP